MLKILMGKRSEREDLTSSLLKARERRIFRAVSAAAEFIRGGELSGTQGNSEV